MSINKFLSSSTKSFLVAILFLSMFWSSNGASASSIDGEIYEDNEINESDNIIQPFAQNILSPVIQKQMTFACDPYSSGARSVTESTLNSEESEVDLVEPYAVIENLTSEIRTSAQGSRILMVAGDKFTNHGYCHIFDRHMKYSNGSKKNSYQGVSQFIYARYPSHIMDIIMDVIDSDADLKPTDIANRFYKVSYVKEERQNVMVFLHRGKNFGYPAYDWVVVTSYPLFF